MVFTFNAKGGSSQEILHLKIPLDYSDEHDMFAKLLFIYIVLVICLIIIKPKILLYIRYIYIYIYYTYVHNSIVISCLLKKYFAKEEQTTFLLFCYIILKKT